MSQPEREVILSPRSRAERWRAEFPYGWNADDLISRRHLLRWAVMASGALFAATGVLAGLGFTREKVRGKEQPIARASDIPAGQAHYFQYPASGDHAILLHLKDGSFVAYSGKCTHLSCAVYFDAQQNKLLCPCHNGIFDPATGEVLAGPPPRPLPKIELREDNGTLIAVAHSSSPRRSIVTRGSGRGGGPASTLPSSALK